MQDCFKENGSEEVDNDQSGIESDPQETVEEIVKEVIPYDFSKTHIDVELITGDRGVASRKGCEDCGLGWE